MAALKETQQLCDKLKVRRVGLLLPWPTTHTLHAATHIWAAAAGRSPDSPPSRCAATANSTRTPKMTSPRPTASSASSRCARAVPVPALPACLAHSTHPHTRAHTHTPTCHAQVKLIQLPAVPPNCDSSSATAQQELLLARENSCVPWPHHSTCCCRCCRRVHAPSSPPTPPNHHRSTMPINKHTRRRDL
jgi:hypothetical protein